MLNTELSTEQMKLKLQLKDWDQYNEYLLWEFDVLKLPAKERAGIGSYDDRRTSTKKFIWKRSMEIAFMNKKALSKAYAKTE